MADHSTMDPHPTLPAEEVGYSAAARTWRPLVEPGMEVAGVAGDIIGQVKEVRASDFLVDRSSSLGLSPDGLLYLPYELIHVMLADKIRLDVPSSELEQFTSPASTYTL